ncbi:MAG TPA: NAD(P)/FAD-dependent oxidoreductase [Methanomassiliicoccales archaeon]|nr:NAD(P)/FAD-dependent oxidoreductase [Methanomassiliicoccales archaeon]
MKRKCDVLVVGGGPGGSLAARHAAEAGADVLLIEKRQEIGSPVRCAEGVSRAWFEEIKVPMDKKWIAKEVDGAKLVSPSGSSFYVDEKMAGNEVGLVLERHLFDKAMAANAARAGAEIMLKTLATGVVKEGEKVVGVTASSYGEPLAIEAKCVIAADGFESQVARWAGLDTSLKQSDITTCFQYRLTGIDIEHMYCEFFIGSAAPGGYVWVFPKDEDTANVGLGILLSQLKKPGEVKGYLDKFIKDNERFAKGQPLEAVSGAVSVSHPLDETVMDGMMLVGDAARLIDPITGGGIAHACLSGMYAGKVAAKALEANDFSKEFFQEYESLWRDRLENKLWRDWMAKEKLITITDEQFDLVIETLAEVGVDKMSVYNILKVIKEELPDLVKDFEEFI